MFKKDTLESRNNKLIILSSVFITYSIIVTALFLYFNFELQKAQAERDNLSHTYELLLQKSKEAQ